MSRWSFLVGLGAFALLIMTIVGTLRVLAHHEPRFYTECLEMDDGERLKASQEFLGEFSAFGNSIANERDWYGRFTDKHINGFLSEGIFKQGVERPLPEGISAPRIQFEQDRIRVAFRYRSGLIDTVVSLVLRLWLPAAEQNTLALQLESLNAGLLPVSAQWLLERISETARLNNIEVTWYRHQGMPVALLRFQADIARPRLQLKSVLVEDGAITIKGRSLGTRIKDEG